MGAEVLKNSLNELEVANLQINGGRGRGEMARRQGFYSYEISVGTSDIVLTAEIDQTMLSAKV